METLTDHKLVQLIQATKSAEGYAVLAARHRPSLVAFLYRLAGDDMDIDDIAQIALIKGFEKIVQFRSEASFQTWLFRIGYAEYLQLLRHRKVIVRLKEGVSDRSTPSLDIDVDVSIDVKKALSILSDEERAAILLCDAHGFSHKDAANTMSKPLGSVKTFVQRARRKMRETLSNEE